MSFQRHLLLGIESLESTQRESFFKELQSYGEELLYLQRQALFAPPQYDSFEPLDRYDTSGSISDTLAGEEYSSGCLILAGGQGTRLGSALPKGLIPVTPIKGKTLLQLLCEKTAAASKKRGQALPLAILTSPLNHAFFLSYLQLHGYFGLDSSLVDLFAQDMLPFLDDNGNWLLERPGKIAAGPDGNGHALKRFVECGLKEKWKKSGVKCVNIVPIDNPLADPFDSELIGYHMRQGNDISLKAIFRHDPAEKMGVIGQTNGKICIREYSELPQDNAKYTLANIGLFCLSLDFIEAVAAHALPWHLARKNATAFLSTAKGGCQETVSIWKFEAFIFDILAYAKRCSVLVYPREQTYAPLKNASGDKNLQSVQTALLNFDRALFARLSQTLPPEKPFELDPIFHYPTERLLQKWNGKPLPNQDYIEADS